MKYLKSFMKLEISLKVNILKNILLCLLFLALAVQSVPAEEVQPSPIYNLLNSLPKAEEEVSSVEDVETLLSSMWSEDVSETEVVQKEILPVQPFEIKVRLINKRLGRVENVKLLPEQAERVGDVVLVGRACSEKRKAAFVNVLDMTNGESMFAGWLYSETPSVSGLSHPVYEVMLDGCSSLAG